MSALAPQSIVIAGGGTAGWMAAAVLARFLGPAAAVTLVESDEIGTVGVGEATIPQIHNLLIGLGIDQADFLRATNATFKLGIEFSNWSERGSRYIHSFGTTGRGAGLIPFRQLWLRARDRGVADSFGAYNYNVAAAERGRFAIGEARPGQGELGYAYHFDASLLARMLRSYAEDRGVTRQEGRIREVERHGESGDIAALVLDDGRRVEGTLFLDCTGFVSLLLGRALETPFVDWSEWLPCDAAWAVPSEGSAMRPFTQSIAHEAGWQWRIPLQHRTGNGHVFCSRFMAPEAAREVLLGNLESAPLADPRLIRFTTGHRREHWVRNCVALGLAAGFMEPLESTSIHLVQSGLARLLTLLPNARSDWASARNTFNRLSEVEWQRIRDFLILHYRANARIGEPFWDHCRAMPLPDSLTAKMALFAEAGLFVREEDELFLDDSWAQVMLGQGIVPRGWSPLADSVPGEDLGPFLASVAKSARVRAEALPSHQQFIERLLAQGVTA